MAVVAIVIVVALVFEGHFFNSFIFHLLSFHLSPPHLVLRDIIPLRGADGAAGNHAETGRWKCGGHQQL